MIAKFPVYIGFSPEEIEAVNVAEASLRARSGSRVDIRRISRMSLPGVYRRPTEIHDGQRWDVISNAAMSTDHALARFFVPWLRQYSGWALFMDGDVIVRQDVCELFERVDDQDDDQYAVMVVKHDAHRQPAGEKKAGQIQTAYPRKNWSSVMLLNCGHPAMKVLTLEKLNSARGRDLHAFDWLRDHEIGSLHPKWNWLVNVSPPVIDPAIVHYTEGVPLLPDHRQDPYADEWFFWAGVAGYRFDHDERVVDALPVIPSTVQAAS
jgi:hypothetical protein